MPFDHKKQITEYCSAMVQIESSAILFKEDL